MVGNRGVDKDHSFCRQFMWLVTEGREGPVSLLSVLGLSAATGERSRSFESVFFIEWDYVFSFHFYRNEYLKCLRSLFIICIDRNDF